MSLIESEAMLARFLALHPKKIDLSLGRLQRLLAAMGHPERQLPPVIHVAGTNGKGSTVAFMRAILEAAGKRVHVYTSPHLVRFHERIRLAGKLVGEEALVEAFARCEAANGTLPITLFEATTAVAFDLFARSPADYLLLEVGLGGRYDATNVIDDPLCAVITPVSHDHPEFLGTAIEGIAGEKAGIIKLGRPVIVGWQEQAAFDVIAREADKLHAPMIVAGQDFNVGSERDRLVYEDTAGLLDLPLPKLAGRHQHRNAATAIAALRSVVPDLPHAAYERGMVEAQWPARLQRLIEGPLAALAPEGSELWLDGGHNEAGGLVLGAAMGEMEERNPRPLVIICGTLASKDTAGFLRAFSGLAREVMAVPVAGDHAGRPAADVVIAAHGVGLVAHEFAGVKEALTELGRRQWQRPPRILIAGSLYLAGSVLTANGALPE